MLVVRVVLATVGTRGDVQPMLALAQGLVRRGHSALIACPATFERRALTRTERTHRVADFDPHP